MSGFTCNCGSWLSNVQVPSENIIIAYLEKEWEEKVAHKKEIKEIMIPDKTVWYCPTCSRIFIFKLQNQLAQYIVEEKCSDLLSDGEKYTIDEICVCGADVANKGIKIIAYFDYEWDQKTMETKLISELEKPEHEVSICSECERIHVVEETRLKKRYVLEKKWTNQKLTT